MTKFIDLPVVENAVSVNLRHSGPMLFKVDRIDAYGPLNDLSIVYAFGLRFVIDLPFTALKDILSAAMYMKDDD